MLAAWAEYRLFPYELRLAELEARALGAEINGTDDDGLRLTSDNPAPLIMRSTYFSSLHLEHTQVSTTQAQVEAIHLNGSDRSRQATRYGPHALHEYKGRFNPQVVRAFVNITDSDADILVDPFCGSGTALVEAIRLGVNTFGLDRSPIAAFLASVKVDLMQCRNYERLRRALMGLADDVTIAMKDAQETETAARLEPLLGEECVSYLRDWFTRPAFAALSHALVRILPRRRSLSGRLALAALSSILREVSLQLPEDLRIRRRPSGFVAPPLWERFYEACYAADRSASEVAEWRTGRASAHVALGSITNRDDLVPMRESKRRLVVTSPPYAMALPYVDTDRLSLLALGLINPTELRALERNLIGSREWLRKEAASWSGRLETNDDDLPMEVVNLARQIGRRNSESNDAGFRKQAIPGLLYRYFVQMSTGFRNLATYQLGNEAAVFIVGSNRTTAGGEEVLIPTPHLLAEVAQLHGYAVETIHELDTWPRYGLHHVNSVQSEQAVVLRRRSS